MIEKHKELFNRTLRKWKGKAIDIELQPDVCLYHGTSYPIPRVYKDTVKQEVECLIKSGVLQKINCPDWVLPTFIIPKNNKTVQFISDFQESNKLLHKKLYPTPTIQDLILKLEGFT